MNILQVLPELNVGGVETGTVDIAKWLTGHGHKCVVVSGGGRLVRQLENHGITHYQVNVGKKSPLSIITSIKALKEIIKKEEINIVHARSRVPALAAFFAARAMKRPFITTAHGYYSKHPFSGIMGWGRIVIVASNVMARHMMENFNVPFDRIRLVPRGVDISRYHFNPDISKGQKGGDYTIGMIGRLTPLKGHSYFLKAISIISRTMPHLKVLIVGNPPKGREKYREDLKLMSRRLGIGNIVEFIEHSDDIPQIFNRLDLLVLSSIAPEGFGRVIIEAQAAGVPVVATRVGGVVDIIEDGLNGVLVYPRDSQSLSEGILKVARDRAFAQRVAQEARRVTEEKFTLDKMCQQTFHVYEEVLSRQNILIIKISAVGDVILSIPSIRAIREKFPKANIKVLVGVKARNSLKGCPYINETLVCDFDGKDRGFIGLLKLSDTLRKCDFDIVVDLQNNKRSHLLSFLSLAGLKFGYKNRKWGFLLNRGIKDSKDIIGPVEHQFRILNSLGISSADKKLELWPSKEDEELIENFLAASWVGQRQLLVGINLGSSDRWLSKRWPLINFARLCDELSKRYGARVVITGIRNDMNAAMKLSGMTKSRPIIACGKTNITQLAVLMKRCAVFVTGDSAPIHVATAVKVPYVALFGPTDPRRHVVFSPEGAAAGIAIKKELRCSPCYRPRCLLNYRCMKKITVDEVVEAAGKLLKLSQN
ncbi:MAG: glycosyltransferase [Candidatus Omnitrophica bacterium]|nr:glycosyltransferase [Candidatus Omnitrophota bacterium]